MYVPDGTMYTRCGLPFVNKNKKKSSMTDTVLFCLRFCNPMGQTSCRARNAGGNCQIRLVLAHRASSTIMSATVSGAAPALTASRPRSCDRADMQLVNGQRWQTGKGLHTPARPTPRTLTNVLRPAVSLETVAIGARRSPQPAAVWQCGPCS